MGKMENKISVSDETKKLIVIEGQAAPAEIPQKVKIVGLIGTPFEYLEKRYTDSDLNQYEEGAQIRVSDSQNTHLIADTSEGTLKLEVNEKWQYGDTIWGELRIHPDFEKLGINNSDVSYTTHELADLFRMNRTLFANKKESMNLVSELNQFQAKVDKEIELNKDTRGNIKMLKRQVVQSNIPESFDLNIPIFKGEEKRKFTVEIDISPSDLSCRLVSVEANDYIAEQRETTVEKEVTKIREKFPNLPILYV